MKLLYTRKINNSISEILTTLKKLDIQLPKTKLANLKFFNHTYLIITRNMDKEIKSGNFQYENDVRRLITNFINYYFQALKNYQSKQPVSKAWEITFRFCEARQSNRLMYLAMGANAHINNDLAFTLKNIIEKESFYSDYQKIGKVIEFSINESVLAINKQSHILSFIDNHLIWIYQFIIKFLLNQWREAAWNNYLKLMRKDEIENYIELVAGRKANEISAIAYVIPG